MLGDRADEPAESSTPINHQPAIRAADVEQEIRFRVNKYTGEELVLELTAYCLQTVVEVVMTNDPNSGRIQGLEHDESKIALLRELSDTSAQ